MGRWLSARADLRVANLGVAELEALLDSNLLEEGEKVFVEAALEAVYDEPEAELDRLGGSAEAISYPRELDANQHGDAERDVGSSAQREGDGDD